MMARSHPQPDGEHDAEPGSANPNPFLRTRRAGGAGPARSQPGRPAHLPNPRSVPRSVPRPRPVRRGGMR
jgi:hypothetical protein